MDEHTLRTLEYDKVLAILAEQTATTLGREHALALRPSDSLDTARRLQQETAEAGGLLSRRGNVPLGGISDIRPILQRAAIGGVLDAPDLLDVANTAESGRQLKAFLQNVGFELIPSLMPYAERVGQFPEIENAIRRSIAPNGSVLDSASPELARLRSRRRTTEQRLVERLNAYLAGSQRSQLQEPVIVQRNDRSCLAVKSEHRGAFGGIVHDTSASGATLFIEPAPVVEIGNEVRELDAAERREVYRILGELSSRVAHASGPLMATLGALGQIDFIVARARLAHDMRAVQPEWNTRGAIRLYSARHPLIDPGKVVAIDVVMGEPDENQLLIITGPNTGGKTATLKTLGLLTLMAQSGLHVPASRANMSCFAAAFADIGDEQSIQQSLSTFSGHITTIGRFIKELVPNSLVLLDEVGAGTDPGEGASLAVALLEHFRTEGARVVATSHYGELKTYAFTTAGVQNASVEFDDATLRPTYHVIQGVPGNSNAYAIAARLGIPPDVIARASEKLTGSDASVEIMQELETARRKALNDRDQAEHALRDAQQIRNHAESQLARFERTQREIREQVLSEVRGVVRKAQAQANELLREIRERQEQAHAEEARKLLAEFEPAAARAVDTRLDIPASNGATDDEDSFVTESGRTLRAGDKVRVAALGLVGTVLEDAAGRERIGVQVGSLRLTVEPESLRLISAGGRSTSGSEPRPVIRTRVSRAVTPERSSLGDSGGTATLAAASVSPQLTLLGQRADEASENLDRYLSDASAAGIDRARIVHGKGTGALRRVVHEQLAASPLVEGYEIADPEEGGSGATIARLRS